MGANGNTGELHTDPQTQAVARIYADAFLDAIPAGQSAELIEEFGSFVNEVLVRNPDFRTLLNSAMITRDEKLAVIDRTMTKSASPTFANFLSVLARHERLDLLTDILDQAQRQLEVRSGQQRVQIVSGRALSSASIENIQRQLAQSLPFQPILEISVDPTLLGGLVIRVGDTVYDGSLRSRVKQLRDRLRQRSIHEIQSGRDRFSHSERD
ncbi:MAG: atpH [Planctomycetaceae bacterium]|nr:atpH [Planctomycetaceae bacterium]